jgi:hypothetical protein
MASHSFAIRRNRFWVDWISMSHADSDEERSNREEEDGGEEAQPKGDAPRIAFEAF